MKKYRSFCFLLCLNKLFFGMARRISSSCALLTKNNLSKHSNKRKISCFLSICASLFFYSPFTYSGGGITHMFIAQQSIALLPDAKLRNLLLNNMNAYLVGADYPDSGYVSGAHYGEDSHWDNFIYTFADYIKEKYPHAIEENPNLIAFLFGCAVHRVSDEVMHWNFYHVISSYDFNGDGNQAHSYGDVGIDMLLNIDQNQWLKQPTTWWVPVNDLIAVYHRMGKNQYTAQEIIWGNSVLYFAGSAERLASPFAYPYFKWKMPWTAAHYQDWPSGGIHMDTEQVAAYQISLWKKLTDASLVSSPHSQSPQIHSLMTDSLTSSLNDLAEKAIENKTVTLNTKTNADGSIEIEGLVINQLDELKRALEKLFMK